MDICLFARVPDNGWRSVRAMCICVAALHASNSRAFIIHTCVRNGFGNHVFITCFHSILVRILSFESKATNAFSHEFELYIDRTMHTFVHHNKQTRYAIAHQNDQNQSIEMQTKHMKVTGIENHQ